MPGPNRLYYGDNLDVLRRYVADESVDLVYLDPPFQSGHDYNAIFAEADGSESRAQVEAFTDTWTWGVEAQAAYDAVVSVGDPLAVTLAALRQVTGTKGGMLAYLSMMAPRLVELQRVLRVGGSLYLHCDPRASHYLKILLDAIFGAGNFRSEVVWSYRRWPSKAANYQHMHDILLYYVKGGAPVFDVQYEPASESFLRRFGGHGNRLDKGATTKRATGDKTPGMPLRDVWDLSIIAGSARERLGYPTQKPEALLDRILRVSSRPGDMVLDPFCGCGTTVAVAHRLGRRWTGIDITHLAIGVIRRRLVDTYTEDVRATFITVGEPTDLAGARQLATESRHQFEHWALDLVGARASAKRPGADHGIDGVLYFRDADLDGPLRSILLSVKSGGTGVGDVRDLVGVVTREGAAMGALLTLRPATRPMLVEAASAGTWRSAWGQHPRIQVLDVAALLDGATLDAPPMRHLSATHKKAALATPVAAQVGLGFSPAQG